MCLHRNYMKWIINIQESNSIDTKSVLHLVLFKDRASATFDPLLYNQSHIVTLSFQLQESQRNRFFSIFYLAINAGSLLSTIITPMLRGKTYLVFFFELWGESQIESLSPCSVCSFCPFFLPWSFCCQIHAVHFEIQKMSIVSSNLIWFPYPKDHSRI